MTAISDLQPRVLQGDCDHRLTTLQMSVDYVGLRQAKHEARQAQQVTLLHQGVNTLLSHEYVSVFGAAFVVP